VEGARKILLVRLREIGDVVFTTPLVSALHEHFPHAQITYLVEPAAAPVLATNTRIDRLIVTPRQTFIADMVFGLSLRKERFDLAIDFHGGPRASLLTWLSRAPVRIGYNVTGRGWMYTHRVARPREIRPRHAVRNQWDLLAPLGIPLSEPECFSVEMSPDTTAVQRLSGRLEKAGVGPTDRIVVVHVSAGNPFRRWPQSAFATVVAELARETGMRVLVTSGPSEPEAAQRVADEAGAGLDSITRERLLTIGDLSLAELRALFDRAALFIGGDSGPLHIAATSFIPIVALYGPTLPVRSSPWRPSYLPSESVEVSGLECRPCNQRVCAPGDFRCLKWIEPGTVLDAARRALAHGAPTPTR
jgi:lipopolysaccharide heptosyltransferase II